MVYGGMREEEGGLSAYFKRQPFKIKNYSQENIFLKNLLAKKSFWERFYSKKMISSINSLMLDAGAHTTQMPWKL